MQFLKAWRYPSLYNFKSEGVWNLVTRFHTPSDLKLYSDGYLQALRNSNSLEPKALEKLEKLIERWILDPSSFINPDGDENKGFFDKKKI